MAKEGENVMGLNLPYLIRIVSGLILLGAGVLASFTPLYLETPNSRGLVISGLLLAALGVVLLVYFFYRRSDEFHQSLYRQACAIALPLLFSLFTIIGILQVNQLLPLFNGFWMMLITLVAWSLSLSFRDHGYRS
ncbi:hypothetical protein [Microbulbifer celer]|uniref:Uncharacterized protein n=1 Tax=Microbulbifer celer TaxID=435905 RepID=A0ABW3UBW1_9GAMM|nr:hypothetical protein [Microbulbifer celer]UFN58874.1 hypothetical protein LPW13_07500 [Microbulbifer celer]